MLVDDALILGLDDPDKLDKDDELERLEESPLLDMEVVD